MKTNIYEEPKKRYSEIPKIWGNKHRYDLRTEDHFEDGWRELVEPDEIDKRIHNLGGIVPIEGTDSYTFEIVSNGITLDDLKINLHKNLDQVQDDFALLITRCQIKHGYEHPDLNTAIESARQMIITTEQNIEALSTIDEALAFHIRPEDVEYYKSLFDPFK